MTHLRTPSPPCPRISLGRLLGPLAAVGCATVLAPGARADEDAAWWRPPVDRGAWVGDAMCFDCPAQPASLSSNLPRSHILALGEHRALLAAPWGVVLVDDVHGVVGSPPLPDGWDQVRLGTDDQVLSSASGVVYLDGQPRWREVVAWDATPGLVAVATPEWIILEPGGPVRIPNVRQVLVTADELVVADDGQALHIRAADGWRSEPRTGGPLERVGAQVRLHDGRESRILTRTGKAWVEVAAQEADRKAWIRQLEVAQEPCGIELKAPLPSDADPAAPPDPQGEASLLNMGTPAKRTQLRMGLIGTRGEPATDDRVEDLLGGPPASLSVSVAPREPATFPEELAFLCDGRSTDLPVRRWVQPSALLWVDRVGGSVATLTPPASCEPQRVSSAGGLGFLRCVGGEVWMYDGQAWLQEPGLEAAQTGQLAWYPDGSLFLGEAPVMARAPAEPGRGSWRVVDPGERSWLPGAGGELWVVEVVEKSIRVTDESGSVLGQSPVLSPGYYSVHPIGERVVFDLAQAYSRGFSPLVGE